MHTQKGKHKEIHKIGLPVYLNNLALGALWCFIWRGHKVPTYFETPLNLTFLSKLDKVEPERQIRA